MRTALALMAAAVVVFFAGWAVDDKVFGDDIPRAGPSPVCRSVA